MVSTMSKPRQLSEQDQKNVDEYLITGYNDVERAPFRPLRLLAVLWLIVVIIGLVCWWIAKINGFM